MAVAIAIFSSVLNVTLDIREQRVQELQASHNVSLLTIALPGHDRPVQFV